ncbi:hypothetical protein VPNG_07989 [Cytospora leucostoma]|uniref:Uncharacterized protein n=1 Tax=Cytospora leucostoma TaxID=1230097 RepID=A0A423WRB3_9PEZI|nr:hypothetical protein VPNG_07989 [Cytospora leucostoma]
MHWGDIILIFIFSICGSIVILACLVECRRHRPRKSDTEAATATERGASTGPFVSATTEPTTAEPALWRPVHDGTATTDAVSGDLAQKEAAAAATIRACGAFSRHGVKEADLAIELLEVTIPEPLPCARCSHVNTP